MRSRMAAMTRPDCSSERRSPAVGVLGGEDEDLVDAAGGGLGVDGAPVLDHEGMVTGEGRVEIGDDPDEPGSFGAVGLEGGGVDPSLPAQKGQGPVVSAWTGAVRGAKWSGRSARSMLTTTHRPVSGSRRSWFIAQPPLAHVRITLSVLEVSLLLISGFPDPPSCRVRTAPLQASRRSGLNRHMSVICLSASSSAGGRCCFAHCAELWERRRWVVEWCRTLRTVVGAGRLRGRRWQP